jgi:hypothetical protein
MVWLGIVRSHRALHTVGLQVFLRWDPDTSRKKANSEVTVCLLTWISADLAQDCCSRNWFTAHYTAGLKAYEVHAKVLAGLEGGGKQPSEIATKEHTNRFMFESKEEQRGLSFL